MGNDSVTTMAKIGSGYYSGLLCGYFRQLPIKESSKKAAKGADKGLGVFPNLKEVCLLICHKCSVYPFQDPNGQR